MINGRCRNHGGLSSGPKSEGGRQRIAEAQRQRWERWRRQRTLTASVTDSSEGGKKIVQCRRKQLWDACAMPKYRRRATLEAGRRLNINELIRLGLRSGQFNIAFPRDGALATLDVHMDQQGRSWLRVRLPPNVDQTFTLVPVRRPYGGCQWYFICTLSGYRASVLWMPGGAN
jgi:hypothetical protein